MKKFTTGACVLLVLSIIGAPQAQADSYTFGSVGETAWIDFSQAVTVNGTNYNLTGTANYTVTSMSSTGIIFNVVVSNTSTTGTNQGIVSTGFQITDPTINTVSFSQLSPAGDTNKFTAAASDVNAPGGFQQVELCAYTSNNCSSATNPATLKEGQQDTFQLALTYGSPHTSSTFTTTTSFIRFAGDLGSYTFGGTLPLPSSLSIIGVGMVAWGLVRRRSWAKR